MSELNTEPALAIEQVFRDQRLPLVRLAYLLTVADAYREGCHGVDVST